MERYGYIMRQDYRCIKKTVTLLLIVTAMLSLFACARKIKDSYVIDNAGVIPDDDENYINEKSAYTDKMTGIEIFVIAVKNIGSGSIEKYSENLFKTEEIGSSMKGNGILLLMDIENNDYCITPSESLGKYISDDDIQSFIKDSVEPCFLIEDYGGAAKAFVNKCYDKITNYYELDATAAMKKNSAVKDEIKAKKSELVQSIFLMLLGLGVMIMITVFFVNRLLINAKEIERLENAEKRMTPNSRVTR